MNQISPHPDKRPAAPALPQNLSTRSPIMGIEPHRIQDAILRKRAQIASLELDWSSASERAAARSLGAAAGLGDRESWDRATWDRYLSAASDCQEDYLPRLRRLYEGVTRLEQLADPLPPHGRSAA